MYKPMQAMYLALYRLCTRKILDIYTKAKKPNNIFMLAFLYKILDPWNVVSP